MKYILYRLPDFVEPPELGKDDGETNETNYDFELEYKVDTNNIKPVLIAVEYGSDIDSVADVLVQDVIDDLSNTPKYRKCHCTSTAPEIPEGLKYLSKDYSNDFNYEMTGIVADLSKDGNTLVYFGVLEKEED